MSEQQIVESKEVVSTQAAFDAFQNSWISRIPDAAMDGLVRGIVVGIPTAVASLYDSNTNALSRLGEFVTGEEQGERSNVAGKVHDTLNGFFDEHISDYRPEGTVEKTAHFLGPLLATGLAAGVSRLAVAETTAGRIASTADEFATAAAQPRMMQQPVQQWQSNAGRGGSASHMSGEALEAQVIPETPAGTSGASAGASAPTGGATIGGQVKDAISSVASKLPSVRSALGVVGIGAVSTVGLIAADNTGLLTYQDMHEALPSRMLYGDWMPNWVPVVGSLIDSPYEFLYYGDIDNERQFNANLKAYDDADLSRNRFMTQVESRIAADNADAAARIASARRQEADAVIAGRQEAVITGTMPTDRRPVAPTIPVAVNPSVPLSTITSSISVNFASEIGAGNGITAAQRLADFQQAFGNAVTTAAGSDDLLDRTEAASFIQSGFLKGIFDQYDVNPDRAIRSDLVAATLHTDDLGIELK